MAEPRTKQRATEKGNTMKLQATREQLLPTIQRVIGAVQQKSPTPALDNIHIHADNDQDVTLQATDLELSLSSSCRIDSTVSGETTANAKKLHDVVKSLPSGASVSMYIDKGKLIVKSGRSRFTLSTLPADDFPSIESIDPHMQFYINAANIKSAMELSSFAMAVDDVRYYLNGLCLDFAKSAFTCAATNGHRLSTCAVSLPYEVEERRIIIPRKGVQEISKMLKNLDSDQEVSVSVGERHIQVNAHGVTLTSKLIDGKYPEYTRVIPKGNDKSITLNAEELRRAVNRVSIMSGEKTRGVRVDLASGLLTVSADSNDAAEEMEVEYDGDDLSLGFHSHYLIDVLEHIEGDAVIDLGDSGSAILVRDKNESGAQHVVMPLRL